MAKRTGKTQRAGGSPGTPRGKRGLSKADQQTGAGLLRRRAAFTAPLLARQEAGSPQRAVFESVTRRYRQALMPTLGRASASANLVADILLRYQTLGLAVPQSSRPALTSNREFFQMLLGLGLLQPPQPVGRGRQVQGPDQQPDEQLDTLLYPPAHADTAPEEQEAFLRRASIIFAPEPTSIAAPITRTSAVAMTGGRLRLGERLGERRFWQPAFGARGAIQLGTGLRVAVDAQSTELQADREPPPPAFTNLPGVMGLLASVQRHAYTGSQSLTSDEQSNALASIQRSLASGTPRVLAGSTISFLGRALGEGAPNPSIFDDTDAQDAARALQSDAFTYGEKSSSAHSFRKIVRTA